MNERGVGGEYNLGNLKWVNTTEPSKGWLPTPVVINATGIFHSALRISTLFGPWSLAVPSPNLRGLILGQPPPDYAFVVSNLDSSFTILSLISA